jgi:channel protein (hemolysin III family)
MHCSTTDDEIDRNEKIPSTIDEFAHSKLDLIEPKTRKYYMRCPCGMSLHVMNTAHGDNYTPTKIEEVANVVTHFIPAIIAIFSLYYMLTTVVDTTREAISAVIYGGCCILLFSISSLYHLSGLLVGYGVRVNKWLQKMDHTIIYAFIASTYTPWLVLVDFVIVGFSVSKSFTIVIWAIAVFGLAKSVLDIVPSLKSLFIYLFMGWISIVYIGLFAALLYFGIITTNLNLWWAGIELLAGGLLYSIGAMVFFRLDGSIPFAHSIWHLFTVAAAAFHFHAIFKYVMSLE